jgi:asparagine synthase (glutamine-hydrolysing)
MSIKKKINRFMDYIDEEEKYLLPGWLSCLNYKEISEKFNMKVNIENLYKEADKLFLKKKTLVKNAQLYYFKFYLPLILAKIDQASMLNSVENRTPFLSKKIINFCLNINEKKLYSFLKKKKFLKINFKNLIPKSIYNYPKHGFAFPTHVILRDKKIINKFIKKSDDKNNFFYKKYKDYMNNKKDYSEYLWNELILKISLKNINN